jgi:hypothetical protein
MERPEHEAAYEAEIKALRMECDDLRHELDKLVEQRDSADERLAAGSRIIDELAAALRRFTDLRTDARGFLPLYAAATIRALKLLRGYGLPDHAERVPDQT